jgi:hypothetical protein
MRRDTQAHPAGGVVNELDLKKLALILGMCGSAHDGEVVSAARTADRMVKQAGKRWLDLLETPVEAARTLLDENVALRAELDRLRVEASNNTNVAIWTDVGDQTTDTRAAAQWALDLHRAGRIWLSPREIDFLVSSTTWQGGLTAKMAAWLRSILDRAVAATGCVPPS